MWLGETSLLVATFRLRAIPFQECLCTQSTDPLRFHPPPTAGLGIKIHHGLAAFAKA